MYLAASNPAQHLEGELIIDHRQGTGIDGKKGVLERYKIKYCPHCRRPIMLFKRATCEESVPLANIDIARATKVLTDNGTAVRDQHFQGYRCHKCDARICRRCAAWMEANSGECPGPFEAVLEMKASREKLWRMLAII